MKVIFLSPHFNHKRGGAETNDRNLSMALAKIGGNNCEVGICGVHDPKLETYPFPKSVENLSVSGSYFYNRGLRSKGIMGKAIRNIFEIYSILCSILKIRKAKPDVIFLTGRPILALIRLFCSAKIIYSCRGVPSFTVYSVLPLLSGIVFWGGCEKSSRLATIFPKTKLFLNAPISRYYVNSKPETSAAKNCIDNKKFILTVARLDPIQNLESIIVMLSETLMRLDLHYFIAGEGVLEKELSAVAHKYNVGDRVHFLGVKDEHCLRLLYQECQLYIANPKFTSFGLSLLEAFAGGAKIANPETGLVFDKIKEYPGVFRLTTDLDLFEILKEPQQPEYVAARQNLDLLNATWTSLATEVFESLEKIEYDTSLPRS